MSCLEALVEVVPRGSRVKWQQRPRDCPTVRSRGFIPLTHGRPLLRWSWRWARSLQAMTAVLSEVQVCCWKEPLWTRLTCTGNRRFAAKLHVCPGPMKQGVSGNTGGKHTVSSRTCGFHAQNATLHPRSACLQVLHTRLWAATGYRPNSVGRGSSRCGTPLWEAPASGT